MARSREVLLQLALLLAVLLAAAPGDAAAVRGCQPEVLAPTVALFCAPGQPAEWCCQALAHSASVGGGARCLCRIAAEEPFVRARLNGNNLLRLYASCRASSSRGAHSISGGAPSSYPPSPSTCGRGDGAPPPSAASVDRSGCATAVLADQMELFCGGRRSSSAPPNPPCCEAVVGSVRRGADGVPCFCHVPLLSSSFDVDRIASLYATCVTASNPGATPTSPSTCAGPTGCSGGRRVWLPCWCVKSWWLSAAGRPPRSSLNMSPMHRSSTDAWPSISCVSSSRS